MHGACLLAILPYCHPGLARACLKRGKREPTGPSSHQSFTLSPLPSLPAPTHSSLQTPVSSASHFGLVHTAHSTLSLSILFPRLHVTLDASCALCWHAPRSEMVGHPVHNVITAMSRIFPTPLGVVVSTDEAYTEVFSMTVNVTGSFWNGKLAASTTGIYNHVAYFSPHLPRHVCLPRRVMPG